jgi:hypothetical protein
MFRLIIPTILSAHHINDGQSQIYHQIILYFNILLVMLKIDKIIRQEIEETTGQTIPDPQGSQFEIFFEQLARDHPELAQKLEQALEVTEPYPEEEAQKKAKRRETIANGIQRLFYREMWGRRVLNRRALSLFIFFFIFGVMATSWSLTFFRRPAKTLETEIQEQVTPMPTAQNESASQDSSSSTEATNLLIVPEVEVKTPSTQANEVEKEVLEVPTFSETSSETSSDSPPPTLPSDTSSTPNVSTDKQTITEVAIPQAPISTPEDKPALGMPETSAMAFEPIQLATQPTLTLSIDEGIQEQQPVLAFTEQTDSSNPSSVLAQAPMNSDSGMAISGLENPIAASENQNSEEQSSVLAFEESGEGDVTQQPSEADTPRASPPDSSQEKTASDSPRPILDNESEPLLETDMFDSTTSPSEFLKPGMLIAATLQKDIILAEGETRQVIADSDTTWCDEESCPSLRWIGTATLSASGRLDVKLEQAVLEDEVLEVNGIAYGADNAEGLPAHLADTTPTLLADLLRAGTGGVSDYVEAEANKRKVTRDGDTKVTETSVPALLEFILGRAASTVQIPSDETNVIRLAAVEKGTRLEILYQEP